MTTHQELRASARVPISAKVKVEGRGRVSSYALAINLSMGGLLLSAAPSLPIGSSCRLAIQPGGNTSGGEISVDGTVIRNDGQGMAIKFTSELDRTLYEELAHQRAQVAQRSLTDSYKSYFKVSQDKTHQDAQREFGVSPSTFRSVCLSTFCTCIPVAIAPVLIFKGAIPPSPNWVKVAACFGYAGVWMGVIQPTLDLAVFRLLRNRHTVA